MNDFKISLTRYNDSETTIDLSLITDVEYFTDYDRMVYETWVDFIFHNNLILSDLELSNLMNSQIIPGLTCSIILDNGTTQMYTTMNFTIDKDNYNSMDIKFLSPFISDSIFNTIGINSLNLNNGNITISRTTNIENSKLYIIDILTQTCSILAKDITNISEDTYLNYLKQIFPFTGDKLSFAIFDNSTGKPTDNQIWTINLKSLAQLSYRLFTSE